MLPSSSVRDLPLSVVSAPTSAAVENIAAYHWVLGLVCGLVILVVRLSGDSTVTILESAGGT